jgi:hypothetical protein
MLFDMEQMQVDYIMVGLRGKWKWNAYYVSTWTKVTQVSDMVNGPLVFFIYLNQQTTVYIIDEYLRATQPLSILESIFWMNGTNFVVCVSHHSAITSKLYSVNVQTEDVTFWKSPDIFRKIWKAVDVFKKANVSRTCMYYTLHTNFRSVAQQSQAI